MRLLAWATAVVAVAGLVASTPYLTAAPPLPHLPPTPSADFGARKQPPFALLAARPVFRHSIVPGGVLSSEEALAAVALDPEVAEHYATLDLDRLRPVRLAEPLEVHVSYRKDGRVRWTSNRLTLPAGELLLTDGTSAIRARCGNRLAASLDDVGDPGTEPDFPSHELDSLDADPALGRPFTDSPVSPLAARSAVPIGLAMSAPGGPASQTAGSVPGGATMGGLTLPWGGLLWSPLLLDSRTAPLNGPDMTELFPSEEELVLIDPPDTVDNPLDLFGPETPEELIGQAGGAGGSGAPGLTDLFGPETLEDNWIEQPTGPTVRIEDGDGGDDGDDSRRAVPEPRASMLLLVAGAALALRRALSVTQRRRLG